MARDEASDNLPADAPDGDDVDMDIVAATYRTLSDAAAFDAMVMAWERKISENAQEEATALYLGRGLTRHLGAAKALIARVERPQQESPIEAAVSSVGAPAVVLNPAGVVVAANALAKDRFASRQGQVDALEWLHPASAEDFAAVRRSAQDGGNRKHAIVRTVNAGAETGIAEVYVIDGVSGGERYVAVRALEIVWSAEVDAQLAEAFELTEAEREVARLLFETRSSAQIADRRKTSAQTVRTQIKKILAKTETASQVDLIRMLALLSARASHGLTSDEDVWHDPWNNERVIVRPDGRKLAYSWTGARNGRPVLVVHGLTLGYIMGARIERQLKAANIKLIAITRPGLGNSDQSPPGRYLADNAAAIAQLLANLGLKNVPAIGLASGSLPLIKAAADNKGLIRSILTVALPLPLNEAHLMRLSRFQRTTFALARRAPEVANMIAEAGYFIIKRKGIEWYIDRGWDSPSGNWAAQTVNNSEISPMIRNAALLTFTAGPKEFMREMRMHWADLEADMSRITCSILNLQGLGNRGYHADDAALFDAMCSGSDTEEVPDAGYFLPYEKPDMFLERIIQLADG
ncbi:LuxR C-terminal-related transcriptional regulator [Altererythrobacter sp. ZODW24]|uniref:LuxR C-terminal-related transcriptional regulator n=1 Tax=Altererythrobacter sp. ZODW24 TaxID=2185142 RepID=UPI000DF80BD7|nr:LuxR C-terminal-related transcriptional regulator [Altererythrobacter sp. ZODW24]